jgi:predicted DNA-binding transcriptional regulator YafY
MSTSARLLTLLALLQTPRSWSGSELAERLEVSRRTVRRDVDRLRDLGYPVEGTLGPDGGYRLRAGTTLPPLLLDDDEAVAIALGLRTAASHAVAGVDEASARALAKLEQVLPPKLRARFETIRDATARMDWTEPTVDPELLTTITRAISTGQRLRFGYRAVASAVGRRSVEPRGLVDEGRRWYLVAWDEDRGDWRIFRVDRIDDPWATGHSIPPRDLPGGVDPATYVRERQLSMAPTYRMVATLHAPADRVAARAGDAISTIEPIDARRCRITIDGDTLAFLATRLILFECAVDVHEPPELIDYLRAVVRRLA